MKIIAQNKKALHDYTILEHLEAGIVLRGDEVKSLRAGNVALTGAFVTIHNNEAFLINCKITPYSHAYQKADDSERSRKLLLHRRQIEKLIGEVSRKGTTIVALKLYFNEKNKAKIDLGIAKHKQASGRKQELKERDIKRETERSVKLRK